MPHLALRTLGTLAITLDGEPVGGMRSAKAVALLVYLAVERSYPHRRESLVDLLWPDQPPKAANTNFRQTLSRLQRAIGNREAAPPFLKIDRQTVQWNVDSDYSLDVARLEGDAGDPARVASELLTADGATAGISLNADLYQGDFLAGFFVPDAPAFEDWAAAQRERLHQLLLAQLDAVAEAAAARGAADVLAQVARRQLALTPWYERAHRALMQALALQGKRNEALAQFDRCFEILEQELGVEPDDQTAALYEQIATGVVAPAPPDAPALPQPATSFVGRVAEIGHIVQALDAPQRHLLTLTGPGGVGKTRLALAVAQRVVNELERPVHFVSLVGVAETDQAQAALAHALGVALLDQASREGTVARALAGSGALLVMDNVEGLLHGDGQAFIDWLGRLLDATPGLRLVVTSRVPLQATFETVLPVSGLALPPSVAELPPARWEAFDAVALFKERALQARATFTLSARNIADVVRVCRLVDGAPLAIELAAAAVRRQTVAEIAVALAHQPHLLSADLRDLPPRHRSLAAVFAQSWALLSADEQATLVEAAVFHGSFGRAAARAVLGERFDYLRSLVERALLVRVDSGSAATPARHRMPQTLRAWLAATQPVPAAARQRHAVFYLARAAARGGVSSAERDNVAAAWACAQAADDVHVPPGWDEAWLKTPVPVVTDLPPVDAGGQTGSVGRDGERARLRAALRPALRDGRSCGLITITGAAGSGKTMLVAELRDELRRERRHVLWIDCPADEIDAQSLRPFRVGLARYLGLDDKAADADRRAALRARIDDLAGATDDPDVAAAVVQAEPVLAHLFGAAVPNAAFGRLRPEQRRRRLAQAIVRVIAAECRLQPVVVHIEDGHWLDEASADLIATLLRRTATLPCAVIVTARPNRYTPPRPFDGPQHHIELSSLEDDAVARLVELRLGQAPQRALVAWLQAQTGGNPFHTVELVRHLADHGLIVGGQLVHREGLFLDTATPLDVQNVLAARLGQLGPSTRAVVEQGAVLGHTFSSTMLETLVEDAAAVTETTAAAVAAGLWQRVGPDRIAFRHGLIHMSVYNAQFAGARKARHAQAAALLVAVAAGEREESAAIARHFEAAGEPRRAADYYRRAGDRARDDYFAREAHAAYTRGLALAETDAQRLALTLGRERVNHWLGNREEQAADLRALTALAADADDTALQAEVALRRATHALAVTDHAAAVRHARQASRLATATGDRLLEAQAHQRWGRALWQQGQPKAAEPILRRARRLAQRAGDAGEVALCTYDLATVAFYAADYAAAGEQYEEARTHFVAIDDRHNVIRCTDALGQVAVNLRRFEDAIAQFERVIAMSRAIDWSFHEMYGYAHLGDCYFELGMYARCRELHLQALGLARELRETRAEAVSLDTIGLAYFCEGAYAPAREHLEAALALFELHDYAADKAFALTHLGLTLIDMELMDLADIHLFEALALRTASSAVATAVDTEAALAWLDASRGDLDEAMERARDVVEYLARHGAEGVELPLLVYHQCATVLRLGGEAAAAADLVRAGYALLETQANAIGDEVLRRSFLENVPYHRRVAAAMSAL